MRFLFADPKALQQCVRRREALDIGEADKVMQPHAQLTAKPRLDAGNAQVVVPAEAEMIASTVVDLTSPCEAACHRGLERIGATVDAVDYVTFANLANLNTALRGGLLDLIEVQLKCVGGGPTLDFQDAADFLAGFQPAIDAALRRRLQ